jgi:hypothetical protein
MAELRPEAQTAVTRLGIYVDGKLLGKNLDIIRAELQRLTDENARLVVANSERDTLFAEHERLTGTLKMWMARCTDAEAERDALRKRLVPCARVEQGEVCVFMDAADEGKAVAVVVVEK